MNKKIFIVAVLSLILDQISKVLISIFFHVNQEYILIKKFFSLHFIANYGAAWSLFSTHGEFLILINLLILFVVYCYMYHFQINKRNNFAFGLIIGGTVGNLIDRIFLGYVRDFLAFQIFSYHYPIFNLADVFIVIGVFLLIYAVMRGEDHRGKINSQKK